MFTKLEYEQPVLCRQDAKQQNVHGTSFWNIYFTTGFGNKVKNHLTSSTNTEEKTQKSREGEKCTRKNSPVSYVSPRCEPSVWSQVWLALTLLIFQEAPGSPLELKTSSYFRDNVFELQHHGSLHTSFLQASCPKISLKLRKVGKKLAPNDLKRKSNPKST